MDKTFAKVVGIVFLLLGILGFFIEHLAGFIHFDLVHNIIHLAIGVWGIWAASTAANSQTFARLVGTIYLLLGVLGFFVPGLFGIMHLENSENLLHLIVGVIGTYIGFVWRGTQAVKISKSAT